MASALLGSVGRAAPRAVRTRGPRVPPVRLPGATIKALAHACGLCPAGLYHYVGSKEELATCLLRGPRMDWDSTWVDPAMDPLLQLRLLVDRSVQELPLYLLALRLADEIALWRA